MKKLSLICCVSIAVLIGCTETPTQQTSAPSSNDATQSETDKFSEWPLKSLPEVSQALANGEISSENLTQAYINRINRLDRAGPTLQSVLTLNPDALAEAKRMDEMLADGNIAGPLHGVPVLLKDNIESKDNMATTAGALALQYNVTGRDSPLAAGLRDAGAIILGKTNLSQWANFRSNNSMSGWSALGGQVKNPQILDRNPCGSSSGSGAAAAASLAAGTVGTETNGSIICPSTANGIVGFKPTVGLVSQEYIIPISNTQDTAGPMTKTVRGAAMMLSAMATSSDTDFAVSLNSDSLSGARIGVMRFAQGSNPHIIAKFNAAIEDIEAKGAEIIEIEDFSPDAENFWGDAYTVLKYEFKDTLNTYLAETPDVITSRSLENLIAYNLEHSEIELALFDQSIFDESQAMGPVSEADYSRARETVLAATRQNGIDKLLSDNAVDLLIAPSGPIPGQIDAINGDVWPDWAGAGYLAAIAGYPNLTVPMGQVHNMSTGLSFIGGKDMDAEILSYGYAYEQATGHRTDPLYLETAEKDPKIAAAMARK